MKSHLISLIHNVYILGRQNKGFYSNEHTMSLIKQGILHVIG